MSSTSSDGFAPLPNGKSFLSLSFQDPIMPGTNIVPPNWVPPITWSNLVGEIKCSNSFASSPPNTCATSSSQDSGSEKPAHFGVNTPVTHKLRLLTFRNNRNRICLSILLGSAPAVKQVPAQLREEMSKRHPFPPASSS